MPDQPEETPLPPEPAHGAAPGPEVRDRDELVSRPAWARELYLRRVERGMTQQALARASGIDYSVLSQYERGHRRPSPRNQRRLNDALAGPES